MDPNGFQEERNTLTPLDPDEAEGLLPGHLETRGELDEWEQSNIAEGLAWLTRRRGGSILSMESLRELHRRMFGKTWQWAGTHRTTGKTLGLPASQLSEAVKSVVENTRHQFEVGVLETDEIAIRFHHELVRIRPFANGNGRHARLMTDQLLREHGQESFTWGSANLDMAGEARSVYMAALRKADGGSYDALRECVRS